ncbi:MAG: FtsX-like permease family protein [Lachnospiraceae bacterium]|nr:FtsX-like permease family protein [Lachnospiraceae bacterium]
MNTLSFAYKNFTKKFSFYALYLFSVSLVITIFFSFTSFSMNHVMLEKISENGRVESMCNTISVFLMVFVVFYMSYSNRFFLKQRTKELGIYTLLGYRKSVVLRLLTFENFFVCGFALVIGLVVGAAAHKGIVFGISELLGLSIDTAEIPFFQLSAVIKTALFILLVIFILALSNGRFLLRISLMGLIRFEKKAEKNLIPRRLPALLGLIMISAGYGLSLDIIRGLESVWFSIGFYVVGMLTMMLIGIGTVFFISAFLPYVVGKSRKSKKAFYTGARIITTPNFIYRIRTNARTLIMLTLLSAAALTISSVMALSLYYPIAAVSRMTPSELECRLESDRQIDEIKLTVGKYADNKDISFIRTDLYKITSPADGLPMEYYVGTAKGDSDNEKILRTPGFECISYTDYLALLGAQGKQRIAEQLPGLQEKECILVKYQPNQDGRDEKGEVYPLNIGENMLSLIVKDTTLNNPLSFANSVGTLIVSDSVYAVLQKECTPEASILSINGQAIKDNEPLYAELKEVLHGSPYLQGSSHRIHEIFSLSSSTFLLIGFLVVLFYTAVGSILYFNNVSTAADSRADYEMLWKMGYSDKMLRKIIRKQVFPFFMIPFTFGLLDCIFATLVFKTGLMQNLLGSSPAQFLPTLFAILLTAFLYLLYYLLTIHSCYTFIPHVRAVSCDDTHHDRKVRT